MLKSTAICILLFTFSLKLAAQTSITVILKTYIKIDSVAMMDISQREYHILPYKDTLKFNFNKNNLDLYNIQYFVKKEIHFSQLWLDPGNVTVKAHLADTANLIVDTALNSPVYYSVINYLKIGHTLMNNSIAHNNFMLGEIQRYLETPRSIAIAIDYVNSNQNSKANLLKLKQIIAKQKKDFSWHFLYPIGIEKMNKLLKIKSIPISDFVFTDRKDQTAHIKLKNYDYYILDFWFVGCANCAEQHIIIKNDLQKLKDHHVQVIGICIDKNAIPWKEYLLQHKYNWDNYLQAGEHTLSAYLGINAFPTYLMLNTNGEIISPFNSLAQIFASLNIH